MPKPGFDDRTLGACLKDTATRYPDRIAIEYAPSAAAYWNCTWKELDEVTDLLAVRLVTHWDIKKGMHVGIWSMNSPAFVQTYLALAKIGAVTCVFNTAYREAEMAEVLRQSDTKVLFYEGGFRDSVFDEIIPKLKESVPGVLHFVHLNEKEGDVWLAPESFSEAERTSPLLSALREEFSALPADSILNVIFTSGTTSVPKGVQLTHFNIVNTTARVAKCMHWKPEDKVTVAVALYHGFGLNTGVASCVYMGMTMHLIPGFRTEPVWNAIDKFRCTVMLGVPSMYLALVRKEGAENHDGTSLTSGIVGGAILRYEEYREILSHFPNLNLIPSFGMTEASTSGSFCDWDDPCHGGVLTCGKFPENAYARVADWNTGEVLCTNLLPGTEDPYLPAGAKDAGWPVAPEGAMRTGELQLAGFNIFPGYYKMPEETEKSFTEDGWFRSGDLGYFTKDGDFVLTGRLKALIIRSGENISPGEIEDVILATGMVEDVRVVGVPNAFTGEEIAACIVEKKGLPLPEAELMKHLREKLAYFKLPKFLLLFNEFPMTASGKVRIGMLKERAAALTEGKSEFQTIRDHA